MKRLIVIAVICLLLVESTFAQTASFRDVSSSAGIGTYGSNYGISFGDYDNDGDDDAYITMRDGNPNLLFRNDGNGSFTEVAASLGIDNAKSSTGALWVDFDNDGDLDLYVGNTESANTYYINNGNGTFSDKTAEAGLGDESSPLSMNAGDLDNDGFVDIYLANIHEENVLYHNNGDGTFTNIIFESGATDTQIAMGGILFDYDNDRDLDIYLTHDARQDFILYENDGSGHFTDVSVQAGVNYQGFGMGVDVADFNNDGHLDIYVTNLFENFLAINNGDKTFTEIGAAAGVDDYGMGWGVLCLDYDNDGLQDVYAVNNGVYSPHPNMLYKNNGDNTFNVVSGNTILESPFVGYGAACTDVDDDGDVDIFIANAGTKGGNQLFINESTRSNWLKLKAIGTVTNRSGIGARVEVKTATRTLIDEVIAGSSYLSQNSLTLHFGLGSDEIIEELTIKWPSGITEVYNDIEVNNTYAATEETGIAVVNKQDVVTSIENELEAYQAVIYPNPFNGQLKIEFDNPEKQRVTIGLYDALGQQITQIADEEFLPGRIDLAVEEQSLRNGIYLVKVNSKSVNFSQKVYKE
ncbi:MAG: FG-GAP-like repeat-containing protein [Bacteroidota bacterium]